MSDRFKFRIKFIQDNKVRIEDVSVIDFRTKMYFFEKDGTTYNTGFANAELIQSTGLKDSAGKLIFEGDIVKLSGEDPYSNCQFTTDYDWEYIGKVQEFDCAWEVCGKDSSSIWLYEYLNKDEVENIKIIGNIFQDKYLLEVKD